MEHQRKKTYVDNSGVHYIYQNSGTSFMIYYLQGVILISSLIAKESEKNTYKWRI